MDPALAVLIGLALAVVLVGLVAGLVVWGFAAGSSSRDAEVEALRDDCKQLGLALDVAKAQLKRQIAAVGVVLDAERRAGGTTGVLLDALNDGGAGAAGEAPGRATA